LAAAFAFALHDGLERVDVGPADFVPFRVTGTLAWTGVNHELIM
jgi:hypothetical protein